MFPFGEEDLLAYLAKFVQPSSLSLQCCVEEVYRDAAELGDDELLILEKEAAEDRDYLKAYAYQGARELRRKHGLNG